MKRLLKLAVIVGGIVVASKMAAAKKAEWQGLTESQARQKLDSRLPGEMPADKRDMVINKVVSRMQDKGILSEDVDAAETTEPVVPVTTASDSG